MKILFIYGVILSAIILPESIELLSGFNIDNYKLEKYGKSIDILTISINPDEYNLEIFNSSKRETSLKDISYENDYILVFNARMFDTDYKTSMGYMKNNGH